MADQNLVNLSQTDSDFYLKEAVAEAIYDDEVVREPRVPIDVAVEDGVVTLNGVVLTEIMRDRILFAAASTSGVKKVVDALYTDPQLERIIARTLANDLDLKKEGLASVEINSYQGAVTLHGKVKSDEQREAILETTVGIEGVREAIDRLSVAANQTA